MLCWNIRGIIDEAKWLPLRNKIDESSCSVVCLQETKRESFYITFVQKFAPRRFDSFEYSPSLGASGGILVLWNSSLFTAEVQEILSFAVVIQFTFTHNLQKWTLTTVYGPTRQSARSVFIEWFQSRTVD